MRNSDNWGQEDWRENIRENHDITPDDMERELALERALAAVIVGIAVLGGWKLLDLACGSLGAFAGLNENTPDATLKLSLEVEF